MQNIQEVEFNKNCAKYVPEYLADEVPQYTTMNSSHTSVLNIFFSILHKPHIVKKLWPVTVLIGMCEVVIGLCLFVYIALHAREYDMLYNTEKSHLISSLSIFASGYLFLTGLLLLFAVLFENQESIRIHIFMASFMCVYLFALSCIKIHFALLVIERDAAKIIVQATNQVLLSVGGVIGVTTLFGSVSYFISTVTVFMYYNLKYIQTDY